MNDTKDARTAGSALRAWRLEREMTQEDVEKAIGYDESGRPIINQQLISRIEGGRIADPSFQTIVLLSRVLDKTLDDMVQIYGI